MMRSIVKRTLVCGGLACLLASPARAQEETMFPFVVPWDDATPSITNISSWLEAPAGKDGFVTVKGDKLFVGDKRIRFLGVNMAFGGNFPTHEDADKIAARMAKFGINCVRFHHMDNSTAPGGIWAADRKTLDPKQVDRLDYFVAALKKHGIYSNINLHVSREYPDMPRWKGMPGYFKGLDNFYPPMIEMQKEYARQLLTHTNPYTKTTYATEPAVAIVEINNENGLISEFWNGSLDAMSPAYRDELIRQWNAWLAKQYSSADALGKAWSVGAVAGGAEMLSNGGFSKGTEGWNFEQHEGAAATTTVEQVGGKPVLQIDVQTPGKEPWHVQMSQGKLKLEKGRSYTVTFRAKSSEPRKISATLAQASAPWDVYGVGEVSLTNEWKDVTLRIPADNDDAAGRLIIGSLGTAKGVVSIEGLSLKPAATVGVAEGEALGTLSVLKRREGVARTPAAQQDWMNFLWETESNYWLEMARYLKEDLGVKAPLIGSAVGFSPSLIQSKLDIVDVHAYWQHPHFPKAAWSDLDWTVRNISMAGAADGGVIPWMTQRRVAGKPFMCTEFNASSPNTYSSEAFLLLGAYSSMLEWDGLFIFAYSHRANDWDMKRFKNFFDIDQHPAKMVTLPAAAAMLLRGDVKGGGEPFAANVGSKAIIPQATRGGSWWTAEAFGIPRMTAMERPVAMELTDAEHKRAMPVAPDITKPILSLTRELTWDVPAKRVTVDTARSIALIGAVPDKPVTLSGVTLTPKANSQNWAAISLTVIKGNGFAEPGNILLTATGNTENTGTQWKDAKKTSVGRDWGSAPSIVEGVPASIGFAVNPSRIKVWALDERGRRREAVNVHPSGEGAVIEIGPAYKTLWYEIEIQ